MRDPELIGSAIGFILLSIAAALRHFSGTGDDGGEPKKRKASMADVVNQLEMLRSDANVNAAKQLEFSTSVTVALSAQPALTVNRDSMTIRHANNAVHLLFGCAPGQLIGQSLESLLVPEDRKGHRFNWDAFWKDPTARPMALGRSLRALRADGQVIYVQIALIPDSTFVVAHLSPVTLPDYPHPIPIPRAAS